VLRGKVLARQGWFTFQLGQHSRALGLLQQSLSILLDAGEVGRAEAVFPWNYLAAAEGHLGKYSASEEHARQSVATCRKIDDRFNLSIALNVLGQVRFAQGAYDESKTCCLESLQLARALDHRWGIAFSLFNLGQVAFAMDNYAEAKTLFEESLHLRQEINDPRGIAICLNHLGKVAVSAGDLAEAERQHEASLAIFDEIGNQWGSATTLIRLGSVALARNDTNSARRHLITALRLASEIEATPILLHALIGIATVLSKTNQPEQAIEMLARVIDHPQSRKDHQDEAARLLSRLSGNSQLGQPKPADLDRGIGAIVAELLNAES
jgi:tetratricopeptide (TPR) repeat protein